MTSDLSRELDRDRRTVRRGYSASFMSNTKWRSVLTVLQNKKLGIRQLRIKFIDDDQEKELGLPSLSTPLEFMDTVEFGPVPLISIEWMEIPKTVVFLPANNVPPEQYKQNLSDVRSALEDLGKQLNLLNSKNGLRIIGHIR